MNANNALFDAVERGSTKDIRAAVKAGAKLNKVRRSDAYTPLNIAIEKEDLKVVRELLKLGAPPNGGIVDNLEFAIESENVELLKLLLKHDADPNQKMESGGSLRDYTVALVRACNGKNVEIVKALLRAGADPNLPDSHGIKPLDVARKKRRAAIVKILEPLTDQSSRNLEKERDKRQLKRLMSLIKANKAEEVEKILAKKSININRTDEGEIWTPLTLAIDLKHHKVIEVLLAAGANPNVCGTQSPMELATRSGDMELIQRLLAVGADINVQTAFGISPLWAAMSMERVEIAKLLISLGADVNAKNCYGCPILYEARNWEKRKERPNAVVPLLLEKGASDKRTWE